MENELIEVNKELLNVLRIAAWQLISNNPNHPGYVDILFAINQTCDTILLKSRNGTQPAQASVVSLSKQ